MTKKEVVAQICEKTGMESKDVSLTLDTMFKVIEESLSKGKPIYLRGFASLIVKKKKAKKGRKNFQSGGIGEQINIPEKFAPKFIPSKRIVKRVEKLPV
jgi:DNA-binding protein HU-beta